MKGACIFIARPRGKSLPTCSAIPAFASRPTSPSPTWKWPSTRKRTPAALTSFTDCVIIRGAARIVPDGDLKTAALNALVAKHEGNRSFSPVTPESASYKACRVVEIRPERMTAKSDLAQNKPREGARKEIAERLTERGLPGDLEAVRAMGYEIEPTPAGGGA